jgi:hypothetical protein
MKTQMHVAKSAPSEEGVAEKTLSSLYEFVRISTAGRVKPWYIKRSARKLVAHLQTIRQVKTLWQVDRAVDLKQFYCDSYLMIDKKRVLIHTIGDLRDKRRVLISGIAGQGKSILLRYLCSSALLAGTIIPVFIELRRVLNGESLNEHIKQFLTQIGIPEVGDEVLPLLLGSGKLILFLDGFDEVSETDKPKIVREIEQLASTHDQLGIIVTSRPESGLEVSPSLEVIRLSDLQKGEYQIIIKKLSEDPKFAENLIKQVEANKTKLEDLLCTPLLVTLLVMSYKSFQELPERLSEFYDSIFQVLLQRHDGTKPGFKRPRRCDFNDNQYRAVFESFCFESNQRFKSIFDYDDVSISAKISLKRNNLTEADGDKYLEDIIKVTCLILKEGKEYRFIHKSVQEYYAAAFIKHRPEPVARRFYEQLSRRPLTHPWRQELHFLSEIDSYRYNKYFYLPYLCRFLGFDPTSIPSVPPTVDAEYAGRILEPIQIGLSIGPGQKPFLATIRWGHDLLGKYIDKLIDMDFGAELEAVKANQFTLLPNDQSSASRHDPLYRFSISEIIRAGIKPKDFIGLAQAAVTDAMRLIRRTADAIAKEEAVDLRV